MKRFQRFCLTAISETEKEDERTQPQARKDDAAHPDDEQEHPVEKRFHGQRLTCVWVVVYFFFLERVEVVCIGHFLVLRFERVVGGGGGPEARWTHRRGVATNTSAYCVGAVINTVAYIGNGDRAVAKRVSS